MNISIVQSRLDSYGCKTDLEEENALREIAQEIILSGLSRAGFFRKAAFQGGTCLRIIHGMERFSEDLNFALIKKDENFLLMSYIEILCKELQMYGFNFSPGNKFDTNTVVQKEFIKDSSITKLLSFQYFKSTGHPRSIKIKLEVDTNPPEGAEEEIRFLDYPFAYEVAVYEPESLFAGKCHALLCREYVKGRDWYDFSWYISKKIGINLKLLENALNQMGPWKNQGIKIDKAWCLENLRKRIAGIDWKKAVDDVKRFVKPYELPSLELWSSEFFFSRVDKLESYW